MKSTVGAVAMIVVLGACGAGATPRAQCAAPGVRVNVDSLPRDWVARGKFTVCRDSDCRTQASPFTPSYGRGPFFAGSIDDTAPVAVTLRVELDGVAVLNARTAHNVRPSAARHAEVSEVCGAQITLYVGTDRTTLRPSV